MRAFFAPEIACWRGERPLWTVFWGYGVLVSTAFGLLYAMSMLGGRTMLQQVLLPCMALYTFWLLVSLWRSSKSAKNPFWGTLARQVVVVWALNTIMVLSFLQLGLIQKYLDVTSINRARDTSAYSDRGMEGCAHFGSPRRACGTPEALAQSRRHVSAGPAVRFPVALAAMTEKQWRYLGGCGEQRAAKHYLPAPARGSASRPERG